GLVLRFSEFTGEFRIGQALIGHLADQIAATRPVVVLAVVETERLFVEIPKQMKRFDAHIDSLDAPLQQIPEAFQIVSVNVPVRVLDRMVDGRMAVVSIETAIGLQFVRENRNASFYMLAHLFLQFFLAAIIDNHWTNLAATLDESHDSSLVFAASASDNSFA